MSWVTTCILSVDGDAAACADDFVPYSQAISKWIVEHTGFAHAMSPLNEAFIGKTAPQVEFYGVALKSANLADFIAFLRALPWRDSNDEARIGDVIQLIVNDEHDLGVRLVPIFGQVERDAVIPIGFQR